MPTTPQVAPTYSLPQQSILNTNDNAMMQDFFNNPDATNFADGDGFFGLNWSDMDQKVNSNSFGGQLDGFDQEAQTVHNPSLTLAGMSSSNYQTHSNNQHVHQVGQMTQASGNHMNGASDDDLQAASGLYNMFTHGQNASRVSTFDASGGASWGNFGVNNPMMPVQDQLQSPMTSSGRQSANSYGHHSHRTSINQQRFQNMHTDPRMMQQLHQQQVLSAGSRARHGSLQLETSAFNFYPPQPDMRPPYSANAQLQHVSRPPAVRFGSDNNFSHYGYKPPNGYGSHEQEKFANLNNVPLAAQAAANGHSHVQGFTPVGQPRTHQGCNMQGNVQNLPTTSSPPHFGGLPISSPMSGINRHSHPFNNMVHHTTENDDEDLKDYEDGFDEPQSRKRRKSQVEREDEDEYTPSGPTKKRASRAMVGDGSDDEYAVTPPTSKASIKRRKSNAMARQSLGSSLGDSPATSPSVEPNSSTEKKRNRNAQPRLNLTEEEKRRNHIQSEKHRRDLIKNQYDELDIMIPGLKSGKSGLSRSDILKEIVTYVEAVIAGNRQWEDRLDFVLPSSASASAGPPG